MRYRHAFTLIEVVAALALLGSLLVAMLVAHGRLMRQWHAGNRKQVAVAEADALLSGWAASGEAVPYPATGESPAGLSWATRQSRTVPLGGAEFPMVELAIASSEGSAPLVLVEVMVPPTERTDDAPRP